MASYRSRTSEVSLRRDKPPGGPRPRRSSTWARQAALIPTQAYGHSKETIHRTYELMGLGLAHTVLHRWGPPRPVEGGAFARTLDEKGLKEAVRERDARFDPGISRV